MIELQEEPQEKSADKKSQADNANSKMIEESLDSTKLQKAVPERLLLSPEQCNSARRLTEFNGYHQSIIDVSGKAMEAEDFKKLATEWSKALALYTSIKPEQIASTEKALTNDYTEKLTVALALQNSGKQSPDQLNPNDMKNVSPEDVQKAKEEIIRKYQQLSNDFPKAVSALGPEGMQKYFDAEKKYSESMTAAQKKYLEALSAGHKNAADDLKAAEKNAFELQLKEQKTLSPDIAASIDASEAFLKDPKAILFKEYIQYKAELDTLGHSDLAREQFALALTRQGGDENKKQAIDLLNESMKNEESSRRLQSSPEGFWLLKELGLKTKDMIKEEEEFKTRFPELVLAREAMALQGKDWTKADAKFKAAEETIDKEIMRLGKGSDLPDSLQNIRQEIAKTSLELTKAIEDFKNNKRELSGEKGPDKDFTTQLIRDVLNGNGKQESMTAQDILDALSGAKGPQLQAVMQKILNKEENEKLEN
ncbi:MAG: hypothetical protein K2X81_13680, partial [Candidatus Obscuribacterales bacterium]|nr:hypothetical protein [Candidatus Obscuribacterales bacterium]